MSDSSNLQIATQYVQTIFLGVRVKGMDQRYNQGVDNVPFENAGDECVVFI